MCSGRSRDQQDGGNERREESYSHNPKNTPTFFDWLGLIFTNYPPRSLCEPSAVHAGIAAFASRLGA